MSEMATVKRQQQVDAIDAVGCLTTKPPENVSTVADAGRSVGKEPILDEDGYIVDESVYRRASSSAATAEGYQFPDGQWATRSAGSAEGYQMPEGFRADGGGKALQPLGKVPPNECALGGSGTVTQPGAPHYEYALGDVDGKVQGGGLADTNVDFYCNGREMSAPRGQQAALSGGKSGGYLAVGSTDASGTQPGHYEYALGDVDGKVQGGGLADTNVDFYCNGREMSAPRGGWLACSTGSEPGEATLSAPRTAQTPTLDAHVARTSATAYYSLASEAPPAAAVRVAHEAKSAPIPSPAPVARVQEVATNSPARDRLMTPTDAAKLFKKSNKAKGAAAAQHDRCAECKAKVQFCICTGGGSSTRI
jgi:hypothetical protein